MAYRSGSVWSRIKYSFLGLPRVVKTIIIVQAALWVLMLIFGGGSVGQWIGAQFAFDPARFGRGWAWLPLTYMWFHYGRDLFGFIFDVIILWSLGGLFAVRWRTNHFLFFYVACGVIAALVDGLLYWLFPGTFFMPVMGSSGAAFGLFTAFYFVYGDMPVSILGSKPMKGKTVFYLLLGLEVVFFIAGTNPFFGVQLGGLAAGWLLVTGRWRPNKLKRWLQDRSAGIRKEREMRKRNMRVVH